MWKHRPPRRSTIGNDLLRVREEKRMRTEQERLVKQAEARAPRTVPRGIVAARRTTRAWVGVAAGTLAIGSWAQQPPVIPPPHEPTSQDAATAPTGDEPEAHALYDGMIAAMCAAQSLSFDGRQHWAARGQELGRCSFKVWLEKPNRFRMETFAFDGSRGGVLVGDGENLWIHWPGGRPMYSAEDPSAYAATRTNVYMTRPTPPGRHSISHEAMRLGVGLAMNIVDPSTFHGYTDSLQPYLDGVVGRGDETVGNEDCHVVEVSFMNGQRTWRLWLSKRDHLPRKLQETVRVSFVITKEEIWSNVVLNADIPAEQFAWKPPEDWKQWRAPEPESQLLKPGTPAPDFELALADGARMKLSDKRGQVVWLVFWRVG
jgi:outer membrane lipoprotein-sorting protein